MIKTVNVPYPHDPGEFRISKKVVGPRGGVRWVRFHSQPATGGQLVRDFPPGEYKITYWSAGWPHHGGSFVIVE